MTLEPSTVFFDLDDTLFDHTLSVQVGLRSLADTFPLFARIPISHLAELHATELEAQHLRVLAGELTLDEARLARFAALSRACAVGADVDVDVDLVRIAEHYRTAYLADRRPVPGALDLLSALRARRPAVRIGVITNNILEEQVEKLRHLGMRDLVDVLVVSEEAGCAKPDPAIFHIALDRAGCATPAEAVMVGDAWATDIAGARAAGLRAIWLNRHARPCPQPGTCAELESLLPTGAVVAQVLGAARAG
jgi:HAD superfamily hydrolase (TIGR01509 family)